MLAGSTFAPQPVDRHGSQAVGTLFSTQVHTARTPMAGKYYEELEPGMLFEHQPGRTVTEMDNLLFSTLTHNQQSLHLDAEFAASTLHGQILVNSIFTLGFVVGVSVADTTLGTTLGNLGFEKTTFPNPVFIGDTLYSKTRIVERRESRTKPDRGIVTFEHIGTNQRGEVVCSCVRTGMMMRKPG
ncbi:MAG: MaoC family dehydratase [Pseudomonadota bacterium]